jgi:hypothetical protein
MIFIGAIRPAPGTFSDVETPESDQSRPGLAQDAQNLIPILLTSFEKCDIISGKKQICDLWQNDSSTT